MIQGAVIGREAILGEESDRRRKPRLRVLISETLETAAGEVAVRLRNLSPTGAQVEMDHHADVGALVTLRRGRTVAPGAVVWARPGEIGLEFIRPIEQSEVLIHIRRPGRHG